MGRQCTGNAAVRWPQQGDVLMHLRHCRTAYEQETRKIILSLEDVTKVAPNGKQILNKVGLGKLRICQLMSDCSRVDRPSCVQVPLPQTSQVRAACAQACTSAPRLLSWDPTAPESPHSCACWQVTAWGPPAWHEAPAPVSAAARPRRSGERTAVLLPMHANELAMKSKFRCGTQRSVQKSCGG